MRSTSGETPFESANRAPSPGSLATAGRLPRPTPDELAPEARRVYERIVGGPRSADSRRSPIVDDAGRLMGPFNAMLVNPAVGDALQQLGTAIRYHTELSARTRELAILVVAAHRRSDFEWQSHAPLALAAGLTAPDLEAVRREEDPPDPTAPALLRLNTADDEVRRVVRSLLVDRDLDDALFAQATDRLGLSCVVELISLVGYYDLLALSMRALRVGLPPGAEPTF